jgi:dTDP-4-dehydrorhamnose reductase
MYGKDAIKVMVLGATGMLGNAVLRVFSSDARFVVSGTARSDTTRRRLPKDLWDIVITGIDVEQHDSLVQAFAQIRPDVVINCVGVIKQLSAANDPLSALPINALLPHRLARLSAISGARLVHVSTDCVFDGTKGMYLESDRPNAYDLYGRSKLLGEVDYDNAITLRTSIIGHELHSASSLVDWFLSQEGSAKGYRHAIFSGLPTAELAMVIRDHVLPFPALRGLYHVSAEPIAKYDLLKLVAEIYGKRIESARKPDIRRRVGLNSSRSCTSCADIEPCSKTESCFSSGLASSFADALLS